MRALLLLLVSALLAPAWGGESISVLVRRELVLERGAVPPSHRLSLALAYLDDVWATDAIQAAIRTSARILAQCGVGIGKAELISLSVPARFRDFNTPDSRELARLLPLPRPAIYLVAGTRQQPAFDAEAVGRGNSATRPELRHTVWVMRGARDLAIVLAHELAHVLMDSGAHSDEPGNLMREDTAMQNTRLSELQCARLRETGTANGLLQPVH